MSQFNYLNQAPASQYPESQDSGIGMDLYSCNPGQTLTSSAAARPRPSFATSTRRTLPRPPSWPNLNQQETSGRWKFSRQSPDTSAESQVLGDMNRHIQELDDTIMTRMMDRVMIIVQEIVKMLEGEQSKEGIQVKSEIGKMKEVVDTIFKSISSDANSELVGNLEDMLATTRQTLNTVKLDNAVVMERLDHLRQTFIEQLSKMSDADDASASHQVALPRLFHNKSENTTNIPFESPSLLEGFRFSDSKCQVED